MDSNLIPYPDIPAPLLGRRNRITPRSDGLMMETGRRRIIRKHAGSFEIMEINWSFTEDQFNDFKTFFEIHLQNGSLPFGLVTYDPTDDAHYIDQIIWELAFMEAYSLSHSDNLYAVTGTVEILDRSIIENLPDPFNPPPVGPDPPGPPQIPIVYTACRDEITFTFPMPPEVEYRLQISDAPIGPWEDHIFASLSLAEVVTGIKELVLNNDYRGLAYFRLVGPDNTVILHPTHPLASFIEPPVISIGGTTDVDVTGGRPMWRGAAFPEGHVYAYNMERGPYISFTEKYYVPRGRREYWEQNTYDAVVPQIVVISGADGALHKWTRDGTDPGIDALIQRYDGYDNNASCYRSDFRYMIRARSFKDGCQSPVTLILVDKRLYQRTHIEMLGKSVEGPFSCDLPKFVQAYGYQNRGGPSPTWGPMWMDPINGPFDDAHAIKDRLTSGEDCDKLYPMGVLTAAENWAKSGAYNTDPPRNGTNLGRRIDTFVSGMLSNTTDYLGWENVNADAIADRAYDMIWNLDSRFVTSPECWTFLYVRASSADGDLEPEYAPDAVVLSPDPVHPTHPRPVSVRYYLDPLSGTWIDPDGAATTGAPGSAFFTVTGPHGSTVGLINSFINWMFANREDVAGENDKYVGTLDLILTAHNDFQLPSSPISITPSPGVPTGPAPIPADLGYDYFDEYSDTPSLVGFFPNEGALWGAPWVFFNVAGSVGSDYFQQYSDGPLPMGGGASVGYNLGEQWGAGWLFRDYGVYGDLFSTGSLPGYADGAYDEFLWNGGTGWALSPTQAYGAWKYFETLNTVGVEDWQSYADGPAGTNLDLGTIWRNPWVFVTSIYGVFGDDFQSYADSSNIIGSGAYAGGTGWGAAWVFLDRASGSDDFQTYPDTANVATPVYVFNSGNYGSEIVQYNNWNATAITIETGGFTKWNFTSPVNAEHAFYRLTTLDTGRSYKFTLDVALQFSHTIYIGTDLLNSANDTWVTSATGGSPEIITGTFLANGTALVLRYGQNGPLGTGHFIVVNSISIELNYNGGLQWSSSWKFT